MKKLNKAMRHEIYQTLLLLYSQNKKLSIGCFLNEINPLLLKEKYFFKLFPEAVLVDGEVIEDEYNMKMQAELMLMFCIEMTR